MLVASQRATLDLALNSGWIKRVTLTELPALELFARLRRTLDDGESATIAKALAMNARVAMHDGAGRQGARVHLGAGKAHRLEDIIVEAMREKILTAAECDAIKITLISVGDYRMDAVKKGFQAIVADANWGMPP